jgi:hypothetical protein
MEPDLQTADFLESVMSAEATVELANGLQDMKARVSPADAALLERASTWLSFTRGGLAAYERRLNGDMETVPDKALENLILEHGFATNFEMSCARALARDVRLLCFFRALDRGAPHE